MNYHVNYTDQDGVQLTIIVEDAFSERQAIFLSRQRLPWEQYYALDNIDYTFKGKLA